MKHAITLGAAALALVLGASGARAQATPADSARPVAAAAADSAHGASARRPRRSGSEISVEEIADAHLSDTYDLVARLRPAWLRSGGNRDFSADNGDAQEVQVFRNGQQLGGKETLRDVDPADIGSLRFLSPVAAKAQFGPRAARGAIVIVDKH